METFFIEVAEYYSQCSETIQYFIAKIHDVWVFFQNIFTFSFIDVSFPPEFAFFLSLILFFIGFDFVRGR